MPMLDYADIKTRLSASLCSAGRTSPTCDRRRKNIFFIKKLDRTGLKFGDKEKQILFHKTEAEEVLHIQYPGKESAVDRTVVRPWDFRPRAYLSTSTTYNFDMSFFDIWEVLFENSRWYLENDKKECLRVLATLLYRMAFLLDHKLVSLETKQRLLEYTTPSDEPAIHPEENVTFEEFYFYSPPKDVIAFLDDNSLSWGGMSLEGFLYYNELLAWNEDCKYYYRENEDNIDSLDINERWLNSKGRVNNLLTHVRILGYILGEVHLSSILSDFSRNRGVSSAKRDEILKICEGYVSRP